MDGYEHDGNDDCTFNLLININSVDVSTHSNREITLN